MNDQEERYLGALAAVRTGRRHGSMYSQDVWLIDCDDGVTWARTQVSPSFMWRRYELKQVYVLPDVTREEGIR